jgi:hypothetical protein
MHSLVLASIHSSKRTFHGVYARYSINFLKHCHSGSRFFGFLYTKPRLFKYEIGVHFRQKVRENSADARVFFLMTSIHEDILLARMAMQITE